MTDDIRERSKEAINEDIERLREWLLKQPHLPHQIDEEILRAFVTGAKSLEISKQKLDGWFSIKSKAPHIFNENDWNPLDIEFQKKNDASYMFCTITPDGKLCQWHILRDFDQLNYIHWMNRSAMQIEYALLKRNITSIHPIYFLENMSPQIVKKISASHTITILQWFQNTMPLSLSKVLLLKSPPVVAVVLNTFVRPFMKEKLFNRIQVTNDGPEVLKDHIPAEAIPSNFGGTSKTVEALENEWRRLLEDNAEWFKKTLALRSNEALRPPDKEATYGVSGTFRALSID